MSFQACAGTEGPETSGDASVVAASCSPNPCLHGGVCTVVGRYATCACSGGYSGPTCATPPASTCTGVATACSLRGTGTCYSGSGCSSSSECDGYPTSCYSRYSSYSCTEGDGCVWNSSTSKCSGSAWSCSLYTSGSCYFQPGCSTSSVCSGSATPCSSLSVAECAYQPGCYVQ